MRPAEALDLPAEHVHIERIDGVWVIGDEHGEFARAERVADALHYAADLMYGPATAPRGTIWNLLRAIES